MATPATPAPKRFWDKVDKNNDCWTWTGQLNRDGYGVYGGKHPGKTKMAHRIAYENARGPIPEGLQIDHLCRNRACVNPDHLEAVTLQENVARSEAFTARNARATHCKNGHPLDERNTYVSQPPNRAPRRHCRACNTERARKYRAAKPKPSRKPMASHCAQGHPYNEANTYRRGNHQYCRACRATNMREYKRKRREGAI